MSKTMTQSMMDLEGSLSRTQQARADILAWLQARLTTMRNGTHILLHRFVIGSLSIQA
jgi:hypothetical protein